MGSHNWQVSKLAHPPGIYIRVLAFFETNELIPWQQEAVVPLHELIGRFKGWEHIPDALGKIGKLILENENAEGARQWNHRIKLIPIRSYGPGKLAYDRASTDKIVCAKAEDDHLEECEFTVLNANINERTADVSSLRLPAVCIVAIPIFHRSLFQCRNLQNHG
jgi:hypothetical protein